MNHPDAPWNTNVDRIEVFIRGLQAVSDLHFATRFPTLKTDTYKCDFKGKKYQRIYRQGENQRMVECFVDNDGNVYKAESWKKPAKGVRGNINSPEARQALYDAKQAGPYGYLYAR